MPIYHYNGIVRNSLFFETPNICGAFLTLLLIFMVGFLDFSALENKKKDVLSWLVGALVVLTEFLLVCTYSRAAYLATVISLLFLSIGRRAKAVLLSLLLFVALICFLPSGAKRLASFTEFHEGSIANRILLWQGASAMIAQRPFKGMSFQEIGNYYRAVFLPLDIEARYSTMQSDWLTLGCVHGVWLPFILGTIIIGLALAGATLSFHPAISPSDRSILRCCTAVIIAYI
ncbi:MAG: O-antigen ligase family protein, partial [Clostridiales bacterium]|nr:O-antigen ligase family protein [Clostridiales bacterium]